MHFCQSSRGTRTTPVILNDSGLCNCKNFSFYPDRKSYPHPSENVIHTLKPLCNLIFKGFSTLFKQLSQTSLCINEL